MYLPPGSIDLDRQPADCYRQIKTYSTWHQVHINQARVLYGSGWNISTDERKIKGIREIRLVEYPNQAWIKSISPQDRRLPARKSHDWLEFRAEAKCLWGKSGARFSVEISRWCAIRFKLLYTRGGQSPVSGMRWRNEMSQSICSGWFDTTQTWNASRLKPRSSETRPSWWALHGGDRLWEDSSCIVSQCQAPETSQNPLRFKT